MRWMASLGLCLAVSLALPADAGIRAPRALDSGFAHVDGISMFYQVYGKGAPILLIHGGLSDADVWHRQIATLSARHRVIVADSRGQGRSTRDERPITYDLMATDYLALLDHLDLPAVALVGWSDGGIIGLDIAIHHPGRLSKMFIQAANATPDGVDGDAVLPEMRHHKSVKREIEALWAHEPNFTAAQLRSITVPTLVVIGDLDEVISPDQTAMLAREIPGARLLVLPDVGHSAPLEDPAGYAAAVLNFVDG
jgi:pimeloyl-ACP methyl ester carboxylesterase